MTKQSTGQQTAYHLINGVLHEFHWYKEQYSSWFVGESVIQDGGIYLGTPVDPLFAALPIIERNRGQVRPECSSRFQSLPFELQTRHPVEYQGSKRGKCAAKGGSDNNLQVILKTEQG